MRRLVWPLSLLAAATLLFACFAAEPEKPPEKPVVSGPQAEKRFPPLQLPPGFQATLFACDPMIEYPSVIALGPRPGTLFVAIDYVTGLGTDIVRRDEIRLLEDTDADGYADRAAVYAAGFNSIQGLAHHNGVVYVMHAPYLTALRDTKGTGKGDERRDLLSGLGLPPEEDQIRLHNANGVVVGHDGWLYLALGDHGCIVTRPEGDKLVLEGGGVLRCRPDGRDLHVFSTGLRNIYDVALDEELNVFLRDNENDGGKYMNRLYHSFFGADHGYPYLYDERPDQALPPLADLGRGSSAGGVCYLGQSFPMEYSGNLFFCEWGRAVVRARPSRFRGASFGTLKESDFAAGAANDPYGFKPTDLVVDHNGALFISDWADGQRPRRGRGRIYRVRYVGKVPGPELMPFPDRPNPTLPQLVGALNSGSYFRRWRSQEALEARGKEGVAAALEGWNNQKPVNERLESLGKLHAVWVIAKAGGADAVDRLLTVAASDPSPRVQAQALRAVADLTDPVLLKHRLDAGKGDEVVARRIAEFADNPAGRAPMVQLEAVIALGRLRWPEAPAFLRKSLTKPDAALAHAAMWTLRRAGNWPAVLKLLDEPADAPIRAIALRALAEQYEAAAVDGLLQRLKQEADAARRAEYADLLTRVYKKPAPWVYWGFRPPPRPANSVAWPKTDAIAAALDGALASFDPARRTALLRLMVREKVPVVTATLAKCLHDERDADRVAVLLAALAERPADEAMPEFERVVRDSKQAVANRLAAAAPFLRGLKPEEDKRLLAVAEAVEDGPVLAELLRAAGLRKAQAAVPMLLAKATSTSAEVRMRAVEALAELGTPQANTTVAKLLEDQDLRVRAAAALAAGKLKLASASDRLLQLARDPAGEVRSASLTALRQLEERRALPLAVSALGNRDTSPAALEYLATLGGPAQADAILALAQHRPAVDTLAATGRVLTGWRARPNLSATEREAVDGALARLHGHSGVLVAWRVGGPLTAEAAAKLADRIPTDLPTDWLTKLSTGMEARLPLGPAKANHVWLAVAEATVAEEMRIELLTASTGLETIWLNGKNVFQRERPGVIGPYPDRVEATLTKGSNRIVVRVSAAKGNAEFQLRFRRKSGAPQHERFTAAALARAGNPAHGREIFLNKEKSQCIKCHRIGDTGENIGPDLTGLGNRFSKVHIIESILEPSRTISPSYESLLVELKGGKLLLGLTVQETETTLVLFDGEGKKHELSKSDIRAHRKSPQSTMPDGLEKPLTEDEFVDLISYLVSLKGR
jgi:putative membrane-bound dehydrogenase-like protein